MELTLQDFLNIIRQANSFINDVEVIEEYLDDPEESVEIKKEQFYSMSCYVDNTSFLRVTTLEDFNKFIKEAADNYIDNLITDDPDNILRSYFDFDAYYENIFTKGYVLDIVLDDYIHSYETVTYNNKQYVVLD